MQFREHNLSNLPEGFPRPRIPSGVGEGWWPIIEELHAKLLELDPEYTVDQVKEKFGTLRYYASFKNIPWQEASDLIAAAEKESAMRCEVCGNPGSLRNTSGYWIYTSCDEHVNHD